MSAKKEKYSNSDISEGLSVNAASKRFQIPETTLRRLKNGEKKRRKIAKSFYFFNRNGTRNRCLDEKKCTEKGSSLTKDQVLEAAGQIRKQISGDSDAKNPSK